MQSENNTGEGFTLAEILVVMVVISILLALVGPAVVSVSKGRDLTRAGQMITDQIALARQFAFTRNNPIEVRLYQFADPTFGETTGQASTGRYRALQLFEIFPAGNASPLGRVERLPVTAIMDSGATLSTLLDATQTPSLKKKWTQADPQVPLPTVEKTYECRAFRFYPDGSTNLPKPPPSLYFCTLHDLRDGDALAQATRNFFTVQLDAYNGHLKTFRP